MLCFQELGRKNKENEEEAVGPDFEPWSSKRGEILARFTTTEKLSIVSHAHNGSKEQHLGVLIAHKRQFSYSLT